MKAGGKKTFGIKLGIVANEFFDPDLGRMGGFGWAAREVGRFFRLRPELAVNVVFLSGEACGASGRREAFTTAAACFSRRAESGWSTGGGVWAEDIDVFLTIDYRRGYQAALWGAPRAPVIVWVHDPRPPDDVLKVSSLRFPSDPVQAPGGVRAVDCGSLAGFVRRSRWIGRRVLFATPLPGLLPKVKGTYGVEASRLEFLPNVMDVRIPRVPKSQTPKVIFLGRLDPIKRPWLFVELARRFREVEFVLLGRPQFSGDGAWVQGDLPGNVRLLGHLHGETKYRELSSAWALINTSIHEALPISFLEALLCETPLVSCQDPGGLVSRFGAYVGRWDGDGTDGLSAFEAALRRMLQEKSAAKNLGSAGRAWVLANHSPGLFLLALRRILIAAGMDGSVPEWPQAESGAPE